MFDLGALLKASGYLGLFAIIFSESGLLVGFFLPGDSLLFTAGFLAAQGLFDIKILVILTFLGAVLGDSFGYAFGHKVGPKIFRREDSIFFHKDHLERARVFYEEYGGKAVVLARFMPIVRTFAPILAGVGNMRYGKFLFYNVIGGFIWAVGFLVFGFYLGSFVPNPDRYVLPIVAVIIVSSFIPPIYEFLKRRRRLRGK